MAKVERPEVPVWMVRRIAAILERFPGCEQEDAWTGVRWCVGQATVAHVFGGEDQLFRVTFRARPDEVAALEHMGPPYFRSGWGGDVVGLVVDEHTDFAELAELLTDSFCVQAPRRLVEQLGLPEPRV
ncbi:MmcQ/YjbR family DNA-binding protein [Desertihabitans brevis]|uniref:MmcQ/YjbR family DNA-binding protein n=1 Tax=Desertihabitans brevis TaxID=2268447 RepID=A0A367YQ22_9ACTN|nr:MmcQ/YjbR family DNA-binding protein [Desertihabitans brevis]RCK67918.1 MmcQ/YjbR family DNA-binding protein [Desertihabitans brevis]